MNPGARKKRTPDPSATRTDRDWVMIVLGTLLIVLFAFGIYISVIQAEKSAHPKPKGPVKGPKEMSMSRPWDKDAINRPGPDFSLLRG